MSNMTGESPAVLPLGRLLQPEMVGVLSEPNMFFRVIEIIIMTPGFCAHPESDTSSIKEPRVITLL